MITPDDDLARIRHEKMKKMMAVKAVPPDVVEIGSVDHFNELVGDYFDNLIIVDFWAPWCGPCRSFAPAFKQLQKEFQPKAVVFAKLNVDQHGEIAQQFQVSGIPTTLFIKGKKLVHRQVGMAPKPQFASIIDTVLKKIAN